MYSYVDANIPPLPRFASAEQWRLYKSQLKPRLLSLIGIDDILKKYSLKVTRRGVIDRGSYTIEKIFYESYPGMYVPALVWAPKQAKLPAPAVVSISGHTYCDSKAADYVQARDYNLVQRGFIVISYDYFGCFERARRNPCGPGVFGGEDHTNSLFSYTRRTPTGIEVLDGIRAVDYLYSRPDVDRTRIAFTGESGGGNSTYWVSALDDRITLSVPVSSSGAISQWIKIGANYDWHQRPPGVRVLADIATFYAMIAPRPLLVMNGHPELSRIFFSLMRCDQWHTGNKFMSCLESRMRSVFTNPAPGTATRRTNVFSSMNGSINGSLLVRCRMEIRIWLTAPNPLML